MPAFLHTINPLYSLSGLAVGALVGFTGVGDNSLMTPLLVLVFGIHPATAVGTDLLYAGLTKISGSAVHSFNRAVDWRIVGRLAAGSVPAAAITLLLLNYFGKDTKSVSTVITSVLGFALILTAFVLLFRKWVLRNLAEVLDRCDERQIGYLTMVLGALTISLMTRFLGQRRPLIGVTALPTLYPKLPTVRIVGTDIAHAVPLTLVAGMGHWWLGSVDWALLVSLLIGSLPGIAIGSALASKVPDRVLRPVLAGTLALIGGKLAFRITSDFAHGAKSARADAWTQRPARAERLFKGSARFRASCGFSRRRTRPSANGGGGSWPRRQRRLSQP